MKKVIILLLIMIPCSSVLWAQQDAERPEIKRIKVYSGLRGTIGEFTKLQGLALEVGAKLDAKGGLKGASGILAFSGWGGWNASVTRIPSETLLDIDSFVRNGGRAVLFMTSATIDEMNPLLTDLYTLALAKEEVISKPNIVLPGEGFFPFWRDLRVGCGSGGDYKCRIVSYIAGRIPDTAMVTKLKSEETGRNRPMSIRIKHGKGTLWISHSPSTYGGGNSCRISGSFFHDRQVDRLDNSEAARRILKWLAFGSE